MIKLLDATTLAITKLRTRKIRLTVTIVIASLLFGVLAAASNVSRAAIGSIESFSREGLGQRYILAGMPFGETSNPFDIPEIKTRALEIEKDTIAKKTAEAKRLGIPYDAKSEPSATMEYDVPGSGKQTQLNPEHPAVIQAYQEYRTAKPASGTLRDLKQAAAPYQPTAYYESRSISYSPSAPVIKLLKDGKESYETKATNKPPAQTGVETLTQSWGLLSRDLMRPFMLQGTSATIGKDGSIPLVAPYSAVEQMLGLKALPSSATPAERLERLKQVRQQASGANLQICVRNRTADSLLSQTVSSLQDIERNKATKDYQKPKLIYGLPTTPCGPVGITSDTRSKEEKALAGKQEQFEQQFGKAAPTQQLVTFRVIGVTPDLALQNADTVSALIGMLFASNLGFNVWYTPLELRDASPVLQAVFSDEGGIFGMPPHSYAEFSDAASAKRFMAEQNCEPDFSSAAPSENFDPAEHCRKQNKLFSFTPFGSNSLALDEAKNGFSKVFNYAALGAAVLAAIIMVGTVGRTIADSRRETAVFRAIGAKRFDIVQIYMVYTACLSLLIFVFAVVLGTLAAIYVNQRYAPEFSIQALLAYNAQDLTKVFNLYTFYVPDMLKLLGLSLAGGALSASLPLLRNLRRNPIKDMRDDT